MVNNQEDGDYGKIIRSITFSGSDSSTAVFTVYENRLNYKKDMDAMMEKVISS